MACDCNAMADAALAEHAAVHGVSAPDVSVKGILSGILSALSSLGITPAKLWAIAVLIVPTLLSGKFDLATLWAAILSILGKDPSPAPVIVTS